MTQEEQEMTLLIKGLTLVGWRRKTSKYIYKTKCAGPGKREKEDTGRQGKTGGPLEGLPGEEIGESGSAEGF